MINLGIGEIVARCDGFPDREHEPIAFDASGINVCPLCEALARARRTREKLIAIDVLWADRHSARRRTIGEIELALRRGVPGNPEWGPLAQSARELVDLAFVAGYGQHAPPPNGLREKVDRVLADAERAASGEQAP